MQVEPSAWRDVTRSRRQRTLAPCSRDGSDKGRLLVATPLLDDPELRPHPSSTCSSTTTRARSGWCSTGRAARSSSNRSRAGSRLQSAPSRVFSGGPVEPDALIALARSRPRTPDPPTTSDANYLAPLTGDIASADLAADPALVIGSDQRPAGVPRLRRLGARPARGGDRVRAPGSSSTPTRPTCSPTSPTSCGARVLRRQRGRLAWLADAPDDLSLELTHRRDQAAAKALRRRACSPQRRLAARAAMTTSAVSASVRVRSGACRRSR